MSSLSSGSSSSPSQRQVLTAATVTSPLNMTNPTQIIGMKLHPENYLSWKAQLLPLLRGNNLLRFVDGKHEPPPEKLPATVTGRQLTDNPEYQVWYQQDQNLLSLLISSLREDIVPLIIDAQSSRELWVMLEKAYASPSTTRVLNLLLSLQEIKQNDDSVTQFLNRAKFICDQLAAAGRPMSLADFNCIIFKGLRPEFHNVIPTLANRPEPATFALIYSVL